MSKNKLAVIDGETLMDMRLEPVRYCIEGILPQGVAMISGAAKTGKSWMMLDWMIRIAKGENVWDFKPPKELRSICVWKIPGTVCRAGYLT